MNGSPKPSGNKQQEQERGEGRGERASLRKTWVRGPVRGLLWWEPCSSKSKGNTQIKYRKK